MVDHLDKIKVRVDPRGSEDRVSVGKEIVDQLRAAGWSDDPGTGKAVLLEDGRELVNPLPHDPPLGYVSEPSVIDLINRELARRQALLDASDIIEESAEDAADFDMEEDIDIVSGYEVVDMRPTFPGDTGVPPDNSEVRKVLEGGPPKEESGIAPAPEGGKGA